MPPEKSKNSPEITESVDPVVTSYPGPIPPASVLAEYEQLLPGSAERLIRMAEQEQLHRHRLEAEVLAQDAKARKAGQILAVLVIACSVVAGIYLSLKNAEIAGAIIGGLGVLAPLISFFAYRISGRDTTSEGTNMNKKGGQE